MNITWDQLTEWMMSLLCLDLLEGHRKMKTVIHIDVSCCLSHNKVFMKCQMFQMYHGHEKYTTCVWNCCPPFLYLRILAFTTQVQSYSPQTAYRMWHWFNSLLFRQGLRADFSFGKSRRAFCVVTSITVCSDTPLILLMYSAEIQMFLGSFLTCIQDTEQKGNENLSYFDDKCV